MVALPTFISTEEAAHKLGVSEARLRRMIEAGRIKAANVSGETVVSEASVRKFHRKQPISQPTGKQKEDLPEYRKYKHLSGRSIWVRGAEEKYNVPAQNITTWVQKGFIHKFGVDKNRSLLNEQDVAYCAEIYHSRPGRGKWLFNTDGTPYIPQSEQEETLA